jgi:hypothetical protein
MRPAGLGRVRAGAQGLRVREPWPAIGGTIYRRRRPPECHQARAFPLGVRTMGTAMRECSAEHDHGVLGRAVGAGPWGAEEGTWCVGSTSTEMEEATLRSKGGSCTEGAGGGVGRSDELTTVRLLLSCRQSSIFCMCTFRKVSSTLDNGASFHVLFAQSAVGRVSQDEPALLM